MRADFPIRSLVPDDAVVTEYDRHALKVISPFVSRSIVHTAWENGIALYAVRDLGAPETIGMLKMAGVELACVGCFPRRIPAQLLHVPRRGFLNVHPSLLPEYRGPAPLFWQFHEGESHTGVTVHWMDAEFDTGPLAEQRVVPLVDGISESDATAMMARSGGKLLVEVLDRVASGEIPYAKQKPGGSYQRWPRDEDFAISTTWPARRIYNFMRGAAVWGVPFTLDIAGVQLKLTDATAYVSYGVIDQPYIQQNDEILIQCNPGTVRARLASAS